MFAFSGSVLFLGCLDDNGTTMTTVPFRWFLRVVFLGVVIGRLIRIGHLEGD
jgi:hypothetical protein